MKSGLFSVLKAHLRGHTSPEFVLHNCLEDLVNLENRIAATERRLDTLEINRVPSSRDGVVLPRSPKDSK